MWVRSICWLADFTLSQSEFQDLDDCTTTLTCTPAPRYGVYILYNTKLHTTLINLMRLQGSLYTGKLNLWRDKSLALRPTITEISSLLKPDDPSTRPCARTTPQSWTKISIYGESFNSPPKTLLGVRECYITHYSKPWNCLLNLLVRA